MYKIELNFCICVLNFKVQELLVLVCRCERVGGCGGGGGRLVP